MSSMSKYPSEDVRVYLVRKYYSYGDAIHNYVLYNGIDSVKAKEKARQVFEQEKDSYPYLSIVVDVWEDGERVEVLMCLNNRVEVALNEK